MEAYPYRLPAWPSPEQFFRVTIDIFQHDIYRIFQSDLSNQVAQESVDYMVFHRRRVTRVVSNYVVWLVAWEDEIATLLTRMGLEAELMTSRVMRELPHFVRERARAAMQRGFNALSVACTVEYVHKFVPLTDGHHGVAEFYNPFLDIQAHPYHLPIRPSRERFIRVTIHINRHDIYRVFQLEPLIELGDEIFGSVIAATLQPENINNPVAWEDMIETLLTRLNLEPVNHERAMREFPHTVRERARGALDGGFNALLLVCTVSQVHMVEMRGDGEAWFLAAMADGRIRSVVCENEEDLCPICLEEFLVGSELYQTRCSHAFHPDCIRRFFYRCRRRRRRDCPCPYCRQLL